MSAEIERRLEERRQRGLVDAAEIERVSAATPATLEGDGILSDAFRRCCETWEVDRPIEIRSHRAVLGPVLVAAKRLLLRLLRFHTETAWRRQREFNRNLLLVVRECLRRGDGRER